MLRQGVSKLSSLSGPTNPHLCIHCRRIFDEISYVPYPEVVFHHEGFKHYSGKETEALEHFQHWPDLASLKQSAASDCHICNMFLLELPFADLPCLEGEEHEYNRPWKLAIKLEHTPYPRHGRTLRLVLSASFGQLPNLKLSLRPLMQEDTCHIQEDMLKAEKSSMKKAAISWISLCIADHEGCVLDKSGSRTTPTRLIFIGEMDDFSDVRLCLAEDKTQYMTLSHCWGPRGLSFKLTSASEEHFLENIPWGPMPQTFKDAIIFTRTLRAAFSIQYIWIDALCIIQDSKVDWQRESSIMGQIYGNSFCNLAACVGKDSHHGLLPSRNQFTFHDCTVRGGPKSSELLQRSYAVHSHRGWADVYDSKLCTRAWTCQELLLAPRVLYFASQQLFWKCSTLRAEERNPSESSIKGSDFLFNAATFKEKYAGILDEQHRCDNAWTGQLGVVPLYSKGSLTYAGDKLIAISGLAKQMVHLMDEGLMPHDDYVAGLWRRNFHLHLLWAVEDNHVEARPKLSYAPTWSWASVEGTIANRYVANGPRGRSSQNLVDIASIEMAYVTNDPFGQVESGSVRVRGLLSQPNLQIYSERSWERVHEDQIAGTRDTVLHSDVLLPPRDRETRDLYFLGIISKKDRSLEKPGVVHTTGLILEKVSGIPGTYKRCGLFEHDTRFLQEAKTTSLSDMDYERKHDDGYYTISIV